MAKTPKADGETKEAKRARHEGAALARIEGLTDPDRLRAMIVNAERLGEPAVRDAAFRRLASVQSDGPSDAEPGAAEHDLWSAIHAAEEVRREEAGRTSRLNTLRREIDKLGLVPAVEKLVARPAPTERFAELVARGFPDLTAEAVVRAHPDRFGAEAVDRSRERLRGAGVEIP